MNSLVASIKDYPERRNWITGSFFPEDTLNHDKNIEIKIEKTVGSISNTRHYHKIKKAWVIILEGWAKILIDDVPVTLEAGQFAILHPGTTEKFVETKDGTVIISIHTPSGIDDKVEG